jgi:CO/xanthine dehydrogenase FAD-binding subunit
MTGPHLTVHQPTTLDEALELLALHRASAKVLAGGTDILPKMRAGSLSEEHLVSINRVSSLNRISYRENEGLIIGAGARITDVGEQPDVLKHYPGLAHACSVMATTQIRNMATVAGNVVNAAPSADTAAPLLAYQAVLVIVERGARRQVDLNGFFLGPGRADIKPMEIIEAIRVPPPPPSCGSCYQRLSARSRVDIAAVGVAGLLSLDMAGRIILARLAMNAVAPTPVRCNEAEMMLTEQKPTEDLLKRAAAACERASRPISDVRASATYRRKMVQVLAERVLTQCLDRAKGDRQ